MPLVNTPEAVAEAKTRIREITATEVLQAHGTPNPPLIVDVREPKETNLGYIPGAILIPLADIPERIEAAVPKDARVVISCQSGNRSAIAADAMQAMGYTNVASMAGGWRAWLGLGGPVSD